MIPPEANPHLFGHLAAEATVMRRLERGRLAHAWLLRGPRGVGKATLAYRLARRLLAAGDEADTAADPSHPVFRMVRNKAHPDLRVLERVVNARTGKLVRDITVDQVRAVDDALHQTAARGGRKVLIVDPADDLNAPAANALLKLLEEPPPRTVLLLACARPGALPRTIPSRCISLVLAPLTEADLIRALGVLAPAIPPERAPLLAEAALGSLGRALEIDSGGWLERYGDLLPRLAEARSSLVTRLDLAGELVRGGDGFRAAAELLGLAVRRISLHRAGRPPERELCAGERLLLEQIAPGLGLDRWVRVWDKLAALAGQVDRLNLDPAQALVQVLQAVCGAEPEPELSLA